MTATTTTKPKPAKRTYEVARAGWLDGMYYKAGDTVDLYPAQAEYDLPPHGDMLIDLEAATTPPAGT